MACAYGLGDRFAMVSAASIAPDRYQQGWHHGAAPQFLFCETGCQSRLNAYFGMTHHSKNPVSLAIPAVAWARCLSVSVK
jgi:hypothetical protein